MRTIWKFPLPRYGDDFTLEMPTGAIIRHLDTQEGQPTIWAEVDNLVEAREARRFVIVGTGHTLPGSYIYLGSWQHRGFVWHLGEIPHAAELPNWYPDRLNTAGMPAEELQRVENAVRLLHGNGFVLRDDDVWTQPNDEPLTTEQIMAVATLQEYGLGGVA